MKSSMVEGWMTENVYGRIEVTDESGIKLKDFLCGIESGASMRGSDTRFRAR